MTYSPVPTLILNKIYYFFLAKYKQKLHNINDKKLNYNIVCSCVYLEIIPNNIFNISAKFYCTSFDNYIFQNT